MNAPLPPIIPLSQSEFADLEGWSLASQKRFEAQLLLKIKSEFAKRGIFHGDLEVLIEALRSA